MWGLCGLHAAPHRFPPPLLFHLFSIFLLFSSPLSLPPSTMFSYLLLSSFLCCLSGIRHIIVTGVEANRPVKNTETLYSYCPKQKQQAWALRKATYTRASGCQCTGAEAECSKLCLWLFMCVSVCFWQVRGHIVLYRCTLSGTVTSKSQSLAILGPNHCQRSWSTSAKVLFIPLLLLFSLLLCIITQVIVE